MYLYLLVYCAAMSIVAFFAYLVDKIKAKRDKWRISESMLLSLGFLGGAVGAIVGAFAASLIDPAYLRIGFGIMLLVGGIPTLLRSLKAVIELFRGEREETKGKR